MKPSHGVGLQQAYGKSSLLTLAGLQFNGNTNFEVIAPELKKTMVAPKVCNFVDYSKHQLASRKTRNLRPHTGVRYR